MQVLQHTQAQPFHTDEYYWPVQSCHDSFLSFRRSCFVSSVFLGRFIFFHIISVVVAVWVAAQPRSLFCFLCKSLGLFRCYEDRSALDSEQWGVVVRQHLSSKSNMSGPQKPQPAFLTTLFLLHVRLEHYYSLFCLIKFLNSFLGHFGPSFLQTKRESAS